MPKLSLAKLTDQLFAISKKTQGSSAELPVNNNDPQPSTDNQEIFHNKADLMSLYPDCSTGYVNSSVNLTILT